MALMIQTVLNKVVLLLFVLGIILREIDIQDEVLFRQGISPQRKASALSLQEVAALLRTIRSVMRSAVRKKGTTISDYVNDLGEAGGFQSLLMVYSRAGQACLRCGATIVKNGVAGRGTYTCPVCQGR